ARARCRRRRSARGDRAAMGPTRGDLAGARAGVVADVPDVQVRARVRQGMPPHRHRRAHRRAEEGRMSDAFEPHRSFLLRLAYRMLGSVAEAEDVVQDAYLRWAAVDQTAIAQPRAYLARVVSRLCLDRMKSAVHRREQYVGTWLPEPIVEDPHVPLRTIYRSR